MRKGLLTAVVLAGGLVFSTVGCFNNGGKKQDKHEYTVSIDNKEELQAEWLSDGQGRSLSLTITKDGVEQNATKAINDGELTFTVADNEVVRVQGRVVAPVGAGTTTVTAKYGKATDSVEVTITASNPHGKSEDDPLTVAEAIAVCQETGTTATSIDYYIRGIVVNAEAYSEQYGNITFNIGDTIDSTAVVKVFRAKPIQNPPYDPTKISKGSEVLVKGKLVNYNSNTPELDAGGSILTATAGHQAQTIQATVAEALAAAQALGDNLTSDDKYEITGYITSVVPGSGFYMSDTKGAVDPSQDQFLVYYGSTTIPEDATVNAKVKVLDKIKHYVSTSTAGKYAYETASTGPEEYECLEPGDAPAQTIEATVTEALAAIAELADGATTTDKYKVTGYVISPEAYSTQFNNITFMMGDTADAAANAQLKAFRVSTTAEIGARILAGAQLSVEGYLQKYVKNETVTPELVSGGEVTIISEPVAPKLTDITVSPLNKTVDVLEGQQTVQYSVNPVPSNAEVGEVEWSVEPADAGVTIDANGLATISVDAVEEDGREVFTIHASTTVDEQELSNIATLTVTKDTSGGGGQDEPDYGTLEDPLTPEEAVALLDELGDNTLTPQKIYVSGVVSQNNAAGNNGRVIWLQSTNGQTTKYFELYNCKNTNFPDLPAEKDGMVGATVTAYGWGTKYVGSSTTYELTNKDSSGNYDNAEIAAYTPAPIPDLTGVEVSPKTATANIHDGAATKQFTASPVPAKAELTEVTWSVSPADAGVTVDETGLVSIAADATEQDYEVRATITIDENEEFDIATLTVINNGEAEPEFVDAVMAKGTDAYDDCTVNGKPCIKIGTSKKGGDMTITVGAGATQLIVYAVAWNGVTGLSLNISGATTDPSSIALTADTGASNNSPFTLAEDEETYKFVINLTGIESETTLTFATSLTKRCIVWGAQYCC